MGTTRTAFTSQEGVQFHFVLAIYGYPYLITTGATADCLTAWTSQPWTQALTGLTVSGTFKQDITPFKSGVDPGTVEFGIFDETDTLATDLWKQGAGNETEQTAESDAQDTSIAVVDTTNFAAAPTDAYWGVETFTYSAKAAASFTASIRGKYSPFNINGGTNHRYGIDHSFTSAAEGYYHRPKITSASRTWKGRWVGLWAHRVVGGVWDVKAQAELVFAGKLASAEIDERGVTHIVCEDWRGHLKRTVILHNQYRGKVGEGAYLIRNMTFTAREVIANAAFNESNDLTVVASGATAPNEINEGWYTWDKIVSVVNDWLAAEMVAARLAGDWSMYYAPSGDLGRRVKLKVANVGAAISWHGELDGPMVAFQIQGWGDDKERLTTPQRYGNVESRLNAEFPPYRVYWTAAGSEQAETRKRLHVINVSGSLINQDDTDLPTQWTDQIDAGQTWHVLKIGNGITLAHGVTSTSTTKDFNLFQSADISRAFSGGERIRDLQLSEEDEGDLDVVQVWIAYGTFKDVVLKLFASTGSATYNHATYDDYAAQCGAAIPYELLGSAMEVSLDQLAQDDSPELLIPVEKPTPLMELLQSDLVQRNAHLVWKNGGIRVVQPQSPNAATAVHTFTESNKAGRPRDPLTAACVMTDEYLVNILTIKYNRSLKGNGDDYRDSITVRYAGSIADHGEASAGTISARNSYGLFASTGDAVEAYAAYLIATVLPLYGRPLLKFRRTVSFNFFLNCAPGDLCTVTDDQVRDPATGTRGITAKPGMILSHSYQWGVHSGGQDMFGEVEIVMLPIDNIPIYSPAAMVDQGAAGGGYQADTPQAGQSTLTFETHEYTGTSAAVDISNFTTDDEVIVREIDPSTAAGGLSWTTTVESVNAGTNTAVLSANLAGFNAAKFYVMIANTYDVASSTQRAKAFQADDADLRIGANSRGPYVFGTFGTADNTYTDSPSTELPERVNSTFYGDGAAFTPHHHRAICRAVNNLIDYRSAQQFQVVWNATVAGPTATTWNLVATMPYFFCRGDQGVDVRNFSVAPMMATSGAGNSVGCRITLSRDPPSGDSVTTVTFAEPYKQATFTTTSATQAIITAQQIRTVGLAKRGYGWLSIELRATTAHGSNAILRGLAECYQKERA